MMKKKYLAILLTVFIAGASMIMPTVSFAATNAGGGPVSYKTPSIFPAGYWGPIVWCTGDYLTGTQNNQVSVPGQGTPPACNNLCDLIGTFINIIYLAMSIGLFIVAPIFVVWGGILVMIGGGNPEMLGRGKKMLTGLVIGIVIVLCAYLIVNEVVAVLNITAVGGFGSDTNACSVLSS